MSDRGLPPYEDAVIVLGQNGASFEALCAMTPRHERAFSVHSLMEETQCVLMHPDEIRHVLLSNYGNYRKGRTFRNMRLLMGNGLIVQDGDFWRQQRRMI